MNPDVVDGAKGVERVVQTERTTVSIAMCTYNGAEYLEQMLHSLSCQTDAPDEIIVCDDGSTDSTMKILHKCLSQQNAPYEIIQNQTNLGYTGNFIKAASLCSGDLIMFCDQDDLWDPKKVETMRSTGDQQAADLIIHSVRVIRKDGILTGRTIPETGGLASFSLSSTPLGISMGVSRKVIDRIVDAWDWEAYRVMSSKTILPLGHDVLAYACSLDLKACYVPTSLVSYRVHGANLTAELPPSRSFKGQIRELVNAFIAGGEAYIVHSEDWHQLADFVALTFPEPSAGVKELAERYLTLAEGWRCRGRIYDNRADRPTRLRALKQYARFNLDMRRARSARTDGWSGPFTGQTVVKDIALTLVRVVLGTRRT